MNSNPATKRIRISVPHSRGSIFYPEGNINCNGEGSIFLSEENNFNIQLYLPPGDYKYIIFKNQYEKIGRGKTIRVRFNKLIFNSESRYCSEGQCIYFAYAPEPTKAEVKGKNGQFIRIQKIEKRYGTLYYFIVEEAEDFTFSFGNKLFKIQGQREEQKSESSSKIIYQIFPDRFYRYKAKNGRKISAWKALPDSTSFYGGNLKGIIKKIEYLKLLNVEYLYLNPIFKSHSNHRYDVDDYFEIDSMLGSNEDFRELVRKMHDNGIKVVMDVVFNHTSTYHHFFSDILKNGKNSRYLNFYIFHSEIYRRFRGHCNFNKGEKNCPPYETFMGYGMMPKLNLRNDVVRKYLLDVVRYWRKYGIDGIRYDVGNSLPKFFIEEIMAENKDIIHIGEVWCASPLFAQENYYDGITNYFLRQIILSLVGRNMGIRKFLNRYYEFLFVYGRKADKSFNLLSSHDVERLRTYFAGNTMKIMLGYTIMFMLNGYALIYYGDEVGMEGGKDPDCRRTYPWDNYDKETLDFFIKISKLRKDLNIMKSGLLIGRRRKEISILSKVSSTERLNLYFGGPSRGIRINGKIISGKGYRWSGKKTVELGVDGFVLELITKEQTSRNNS